MQMKNAETMPQTRRNHEAINSSKHELKDGSHGVNGHHDVYMSGDVNAQLHQTPHKYRWRTNNLLIHERLIFGTMLCSSIVPWRFLLTTISGAVPSLASAISAVLVERRMVVRCKLGLKV
jgi:hypothetical protein